MATSIFDISGKLDIDTREFDRGLNDASQGVRGFSQNTQAALSSIAKGFAVVGTALLAVGAAGLGAIGLGIQDSLEKVDALAKSAKRLQTTAEVLGGLLFIGKEAGLQAQQFTEVLSKMRAEIQILATTGKGKFKDIFKQLNLDAKELTKLNVRDQLFEITKAIQGLDEESRLGVLKQLFEEQGLKLLSLVEKDIEDLKKDIKEFKALGGVISEEDAERIQNFNDSIGRLMVALDGFKNSLTLALLPLLEDFVGWITKIAIAFKKWRDEHPELFNNLATLIVLALGIVAALGLLFLAIAAVIGVVVAVAGAMLIFEAAGLTLGMVLGGLAFIIGTTLVIAFLAATLALLVLSDEFKNYVRNIPIVKTVTDGLILGLTEGWLNFKDFFVNIWDIMVTKLATSVLTIKKLVNDIAAAIQDFLAAIPLIGKSVEKAKNFGLPQKESARLTQQINDLNKGLEIRQTARKTEREASSNANIEAFANRQSANEEIQIREDFAARAAAKQTQLLDQIDKKLGNLTGTAREQAKEQLKKQAQVPSTF